MTGIEVYKLLMLPGMQDTGLSSGVASTLDVISCAFLRKENLTIILISQKMESQHHSPLTWKMTKNRKMNSRIIQSSFFFKTTANTGMLTTVCSQYKNI
jgi:hypothetical protein